jgi:hypothetical protein
MKTLEKKKTTQEEFGDERLIMTEPTMLFKDNISIRETFYVDEYYAGRIDLVALNVYGDGAFSDQLLKFNGMSNPFAIAEGDVLYIPPADVLLKSWKKPGISVTGANAVRDKFINTKRLPIQDQKRLEYLQRKASAKSNGAKEILPPNVLKSDEANVIIENGTTKVGAVLPTTADKITARLSSNTAFPGELQKLDVINRKSDIASGNNTK